MLEGSELSGCHTASLLFMISGVLPGKEDGNISPIAAIGVVESREAAACLV